MAEPASCPTTCHLSMSCSTRICSIFSARVSSCADHRTSSAFFPSRADKTPRLGTACARPCTNTLNAEVWGTQSRCPLRLQREFQSELDQSRRLGLQNLVESLRVHVAVRVMEVRMVQDVEELCPELDI